MDNAEAGKQWSFSLDNGDAEVSGYQFMEYWTCTVKESPESAPDGANAGTRYALRLVCERSSSGSRYEKSLGSNFSSLAQAHGAAMGYYMGIRQHPDYPKLETLGFAKTH